MDIRERIKSDDLVYRGHTVARYLSTGTGRILIDLLRRTNKGLRPEDIHNITHSDENSPDINRSTASKVLAMFHRNGLCERVRNGKECTYTLNLERHSVIINRIEDISALFTKDCDVAVRDRTALTYKEYQADYDMALDKELGV